MSSETKPTALYQNLDTTFVNLWSLLRKLTQSGFIGRVRVELPDYSADVFITGSSTPLVHEIDRATGTDTLEEAALHRLVLRARETPGTISVFEGADEAVAVQTLITETGMATTPSSPEANDSIARIESDSESQIAEVGFAEREEVDVPDVDEFTVPTCAPEIEAAVDSTDRVDQVTVTTIVAELIDAVARGVNASGGDFDSLFRVVRLELADDFSFLDPLSNAFQYERGSATVSANLEPSVLVAGLSEALRKLTNKVALGDRERRVRERVALELLTVARKRPDALKLSGFQLQLDRIAGTKVI